MESLVRWYSFLARWYGKRLWDSLPGPWYVKVILIVVTQAIPGPQDELLLIGIMWVTRKVRRWWAARKVCAA